VFERARFTFDYKSVIAVDLSNWREETPSVQEFLEHFDLLAIIYVLAHSKKESMMGYRSGNDPRDRLSDSEMECEVKYGDR
jgi:hypothetical protein